MAEPYDLQHRGGQSAYDRYLREMDASMRQKVALTAAHLLCEGEAADMGMGSGSGSFALASLYPELRVIGVDVDPEMVHRAGERYQLPNLSFVQGDIAERCFETGTLEAILDSSVLHHVTSYGGYDKARAVAALRAQVDELAEDGVLVLRDFVDPGPGTVWLELPLTDGSGDAVETCSTAALFERFAREFRVLLPNPSERGFAFERVMGAPAGFQRYAVSHTIAAEFVLRKDYRESWAVEVREEYTYATQSELEETFTRLGLRVLASTPIHNPWIVANRFQGKIRLFRPGPAGTAAPVDFPATNFVIVGQRVPAGQGVSIEEDAPHPPLGFLELTHHRRVDDGRVYDLARRPGVTFDVLPWFRRDGQLHVLARRGYPRPILRAEPACPTPDGARAPSYVTEPLNVLSTDEPLGTSVERLLAEHEALGPDQVFGMEEGDRYYPSPGGLQEEVRSVLVEVAPVNVGQRLRGTSGFSTSGVVRAIEARQLLRAAQVGGLPDARLELLTYELLLGRGVDPGEWIGESIALDETPTKPAAESLVRLLARPHRRRFQRASSGSGFLDVRAAWFVERDASGEIVARQARELVTPARLGPITVAVAPLARSGGRVLIGLDDDDLPAAQCFTGNSELLVAPAWRVPREVSGMARTRAFVGGRMREELGLVCDGFFELGGRYHPSAGLTPEVVYPLAARVRIEGEVGLRLHWVPLDEVVSHRAGLRDGHLRILGLRAAHALGLFAERATG